MDRNFVISLEDIDLALLSKQTLKHKDLSKETLLWSVNNLNKTSDDTYYEFELYRLEDDEQPVEDCIENNIKYTCHICSTDVPVSYMKEHSEGPNHKAYLSLTDMALERVKKQLNPIGNLLSVTSSNNSLYYCDPCSIAVTLDNKTIHSNSEEHKANIVHTRLLSNFIRVYENKNYIRELIKTRNVESDYENNNATEKSDGEATNSAEDNEETILKTDLKDKLNKLEAYIALLSQQTKEHSIKAIDENNIEIKAADGTRLKITVGNFNGFHQVGEHVQCRVCKEMVKDEQHALNYLHMTRLAAPIKDKHCIRQLDLVWNHCILCNEIIENIEGHIACSKEHNDKVKQAILHEENVQLRQQEHIRCEKCETFVPANCWNDHIKVRALVSDQREIVGNLSHEKTNKSSTFALLESTKIAENDNNSEDMLKLIDNQRIEDTSETLNGKALVTNPEKNATMTNIIKKRYPGVNDAEMVLLQKLLDLLNFVIDSPDVPETLKKQLMLGDTSTKVTPTNSNSSTNAVNNILPTLNNQDSTRDQSVKVVTNPVESMAVTTNYLLEISDNKKELTCKACKSIVPNTELNIKQHLNGPSHKSKYNAVLLEHKLKKNANGFDCILCNTIVSDGKEIEHIDSVEHKRIYNLSKPAVEHYMLKMVNGKVMCVVCDVAVPNHVRNLTEHLNGTLHNKDYKTILDSNKIVTINGSTRCELCNVHIAYGAEFDHVAKADHKNKFAGKSTPLNATTASLEKAGNNPENIAASTIVGQTVKSTPINANTTTQPKVGNTQDVAIITNVGQTSLQEIDDKNAIVTHSSGMLFCNICYTKVSNNDQVILQHTRGSRHCSIKKTFLENKLKIRNNNFYCPLCNVSVDAADAFDHIELKSHKSYKSLISNIEDTKPGMIKKSTKDSAYLHCKVCKVELPQGDHNILIHLKGSNHMSKYTSLLKLNKIELINDKFYCQLCKEYVMEASEYCHVLSNRKHHNKFSELSSSSSESSVVIPPNKSKPVLYLETKPEFIINTHHPDLLKCAVCYLHVLNEDKLINDHVYTSNHIDNYRSVLALNKIRIISSRYYCDACKFYVQKTVYSHIRDNNHKTNVSDDVHFTPIPFPKNNDTPNISIPTNNVNIQSTPTNNIKTLPVNNASVKPVITSNLNLNPSPASIVKPTINNMNTNSVSVKSILLTNEYCSVCKFYVTNMSNHIKCDEHLMKSGQYYCDVCDVIVLNKDRTNHLEGLTHNRKITSMLLTNNISIRDDNVCFCKKCGMYFSKLVVKSHIDSCKQTQTPSEMQTSCTVV